MLPHLEPRIEETKSSNLIRLSTIAKIFPEITQVKVTVDALVSLMIKGKRNEARIFVVGNMMPRDIIFKQLFEEIIALFISCDRS